MIVKAINADTLKLRKQPNHKRLRRLQLSCLILRSCYRFFLQIEVGSPHRSQYMTSSGKMCPVLQRGHSAFSQWFPGSLYGLPQYEQKRESSLKSGLPQFEHIFIINTSFPVLLYHAGRERATKESR